MTRVCQSAMMRRDKPPEGMAVCQLSPQPAARGLSSRTLALTSLAAAAGPGVHCFLSVALFYPLTLISLRAWRKNRSGMRARCHEPTPGTYLSAPPLRGPRGDCAFHDRGKTEPNAEMPQQRVRGGRPAQPPALDRARSAPGLSKTISCDEL